MKKIKELLQIIRHKRNGDNPVFKMYLENKKSVLDIGCGGGYVEEKYNNVVGMDMSIENIIKCKEYASKRFVVSSATSLPFKNNSFEGVYFSNVIEHLYPEQALKTLYEIDRVLKAKGVLVLVTQMERKGNYSTFTHKKPYPPTAIKKLLQNSKYNDEPNISGWKISNIYYKGRDYSNKVLNALSQVMAFFGIGALDYIMIIQKA